MPPSVGTRCFLPPSPQLSGRRSGNVEGNAGGGWEPEVRLCQQYLCDLGQVTSLLELKDPPCKTKGLNKVSLRSLNLPGLKSLGSISSRPNADWERGPSLSPSPWASCFHKPWAFSMKNYPQTNDPIEKRLECVARSIRRKVKGVKVKSCLWAPIPRH